MAELNILPAVGGDDGWWYATGFNNSDPPIMLGDDGGGMNGFIRFPNVTIPPGSTIDTAILRFESPYTLSETTVNLNVYLNDVDDAVAPTNYTEANGLALTVPVAWNNLPTWTSGYEYDSPELKTILQSIIDREGWASGQAIMALVKDNGSSEGAHRYAKPYETSTTLCVELRITYTPPPPDYQVSAVPFEVIISGSATGPGNSGTLERSLPIFTCVATGTVRSGSLNKDLPVFTILATGQGGVVGRLNASLPMFQISASGLCGQVGNLDQLLPSFTISANGYTRVVGNADMDLPMFYIYASGHQTAAAVVAADYLVLAMNPKNMAVSEYDWSGFNSFAYFNGVYLGAKAGTIHVLGGDDDAGSIIESEIELGQIPVDSVKPRDVYVLGRADGMMALTVMADEDTEKEVKIAYMLETLNLDRAKIPRGIKPTYFSLRLENKNGSDFDIDEIQIYGEVIGRGKP